MCIDICVYVCVGAFVCQCEWVRVNGCVVVRLTVFMFARLPVSVCMCVNVWVSLGV